MEVSEARSEDRYRVQMRLDASFGGSDVVLVDLGEHGAQVQHPVPIKLGAIARLIFTAPSTGQQVRVQGTIIWSRISAKPDAAGKRHYASGIRIDDPEESLKELIPRLVAANVLRLDNLSLDKKRKALLDKEKARQMPGFKMVGQKPRIPDDVILLVRQTRNRLKDNPAEAVKWYNRAKYSLDQSGVQIHQRDEVLAIWEYLERSIEIDIIARIISEG
ncbi:MAG: PilZ domain-containing protein [Thermoanaerobaculia bacterium]